MIREWNTGVCQGRPFGMFAVLFGRHRAAQKFGFEADETVSRNRREHDVLFFLKFTDEPIER